MLSSLCQRVLNAFEKLMVPDGKNDTEFSEDASKGIGLHDAHLHELTAHAVQCHAALLSFALDRHGQDVRLLRSDPDRLGIHRIRFVTQKEGLDVLCRSNLTW